MLSVFRSGLVGIAAVVLTWVCLHAARVQASEFFLFWDNGGSAWDSQILFEPAPPGPAAAGGSTLVFDLGWPGNLSKTARLNDAFDKNRFDWDEPCTDLSSALDGVSVKTRNTVFDDDVSEDKGRVTTRVISLPDTDFYGISVSAVHRNRTVDAQRNDDVGAMVGYDMGDFSLGATYMTAISLDRVDRDAASSGDTFWGLSLRYKAAQPLVFDFLYENYSSDVNASSAPINTRYGVAATYSFFDISDGLSLTSAYTRKKYSPGAEEPGQTGLDEFLIRINFNF